MVSEESLPSLVQLADECDHLHDFRRVFAATERLLQIADDDLLVRRASVGQQLHVEHRVAACAHAAKRHLRHFYLLLRTLRFFRFFAEGVFERAVTDDLDCWRLIRSAEGLPVAEFAG